MAPVQISLGKWDTAVSLQYAKIQLFNFIDTFIKYYVPAPCSTRYLTISKWPSKHAALKGVELVLVTEFTDAPRSTKSFTIWVWPAAAAHHNGGAPSIVSPSNVTEPVRNTLKY